MQEQDSLVQSLKEFSNSKKCIILCLGNEIKGDDKIGLVIGDKLIKKYPSLQEKIIIAHNVPASYLGKISALDPDCILVVDAANFGELPGVIGLFDYDVIEEKSYSTHFQEFDRLLSFLEMDLKHKVECKILAIQIESIELLGSVTNQVSEASERVLSAFDELLENKYLNLA